MTTLHLLLVSLLARLPHRDDRDDRGDVPGWVLVTVMTATLVAGLLAVAQPQLEALLRQALNQVQ